MQSLTFVDSPEDAFTKQEMKAIITFERFGAVLSIIGVLLVFIAYSMSKKLRTVPNTFILFASIANLGASVACLIGDIGIKAEHSRICQAQAFMFELFMQSDPWWSFAMAVNVYMVFFFQFNPKRFLGYWWVYWLICYGIPLIPAMWLLLLHANDGGRAYGDATIWCWIDEDWKLLRILTYYLPIWICIGFSIVIYILVGCLVFHQRNKLRNLSLSNPHDNLAGPRDSGEKHLSAHAAIMGRINTEVVQVTTTADTHSESPGTSEASTRIDWFEGPPGDLADGTHAASSSGCRTVTEITADPPPQAAREKLSLLRRMRTAFREGQGRLRSMDTVKLAYLRTSFVFAISVLVTWTPSSINRVYDVVRGESPGYPPSFVLNLASAIVLPLQGVWNSAIFFTTSAQAVREVLRERRDAWRGLPRGHVAASAVRRERERAIMLERRYVSSRGRESEETAMDSRGNDSFDLEAGGDEASRKAREESGSEISPITDLPMPGPPRPAHIAASSSTIRVLKGNPLA